MIQNDHIIERVYMMNNWYPDEIRFLKKYYGILSVEKISERLCRTKGSIERMSKKLELNEWTQEEIEVIKNNHYKGIKSLKRILYYRSQYSIVQKANSIGLYRKNKWEEKRKHRKIVNKTRQEKLTTIEVVHHIDCDHNNNDPNNLHVTNKSNHAKAHGSINKLVKGLMKKGYVKFDREKEIYVFGDNYIDIDYNI